MFDTENIYKKAISCLVPQIVGAGGQGEVSFDCISYLWKTIACIVLSDICVNLHVSVHQTWKKLKTSTKTLGQGTKHTDHIFYCSHCHTT